ncbi:11527_t:CDS:2 [Entrophospora sp. SA101]|nr:11527_t:CDS:2 [Entrophospora sp. SA101]
MSSNINLGLSRINSLLQLLGNPHQSLSAIHIAGTNGKGSVSAYIDFILFKAGFKTGRFNSPHLIDVNDSIRINTKPINRTDYQRIFKYIHNINKLNDIGASEFELMTAVAFWWFNYEKIDVAIVEVGLGGRLDATNVFEKTLVSVITSIGLDHADILGDNVETIAKEKAGILKSEDHIVIAPQSEEIINATLLNYCKDNLLSTTIHPVQPANWGSEESGIASINLSGFNNHLSDDDGNNTLKFYMPLKGDFQLENVATAIKAIDVLRRTDSKFSRITNQHICEGIESTQWFATPPTPNSETMMLVDGAHNPPAAKELRKYIDQYFTKLKFKKPKVNWVFASSKHKSIYDILKCLLYDDDTFTAVNFSKVENMPWVESCDQQELRRIANQVSPNIKTYSIDDHNLKDSIIFANELCKEQKGEGIIVLCGSLYLIADLLRILDLY